MAGAECRKKRLYSQADAHQVVGSAKRQRSEGRAWRAEQRIYVCYACSAEEKRGVWHTTSRTEARDPVRHESEKEFTTWCIQAMQLNGWLVTHIRAAMYRDGSAGKERWVTPYEGDDGLPDLMALRGGVALMAELKSEDGRIRPNQTKWLEAGAYLWRPSMRDEIKGIIS